MILIRLLVSASLAAAAVDYNAWNFEAADSAIRRFLGDKVIGLIVPRDRFAPPIVVSLIDDSGGPRNLVQWRQFTQQKLSRSAPETVLNEVMIQGPHGAGYLATMARSLHGEPLIQVVLYLPGRKRVLQFTYESQQQGRQRNSDLGYTDWLNEVARGQHEPLVTQWFAGRFPNP